MIRSIVLSCMVCLTLMVSTTCFAQTDRRAGLAVLDVDAIGISPIEARALSEKLRSSVSQYILDPAHDLQDDYYMVERSQMDKIFEQFEIQNTGCTDLSCAVEFGKMLNVERIIIGSVSHIGQSYIIALRLIDVESSRILSSADRQHRGEIDEIVEMMGFVGQELLTGQAITVEAAQEEPAAEPEDVAVQKEQPPAVQEPVIETRTPVSEPSFIRIEPAARYYGEISFSGAYGWYISPEDMKDNLKSKGIYAFSGEFFITDTISISAFYDVNQWDYDTNQREFLGIFGFVSIKGEHKTGRFGLDLILEPNGRDGTAPIFAIGYENLTSKFNYMYRSDYIEYSEVTEEKGKAFTFRGGVEFGSASRRFKAGLLYKNLKWEDYDESENIFVPELGFEYRNKRFRYFMNVSYTIITSKGYDETIKELRVVPLGLGFFF